MAGKSAHTSMITSITLIVASWSSGSLAVVRGSFKVCVLWHQRRGACVFLPTKVNKPPAPGCSAPPFPHCHQIDRDRRGRGGTARHSRDTTDPLRSSSSSSALNRIGVNQNKRGLLDSTRPSFLRDLVRPPTTTPTLHHTPPSLEFPHPRNPNISAFLLLSFFFPSSYNFP